MLELAYLPPAKAPAFLFQPHPGSQMGGKEVGLQNFHWAVFLVPQEQRLLSFFIVLLFNYQKKSNT